MGHITGLGSSIAEKIYDYAGLKAVDNHEFLCQQGLLKTQYRMTKHLGTMISDVFYGGVLCSANASPQTGVFWEDVIGHTERVGSSLCNPNEAERVIDIWRKEVKVLNSTSTADVVVISMYEAQRRYIQTLCPGLRAFNVDSFQGQEAQVVILTLSGAYATEFLNDKHRINVACSRAKKRLYIVGDEGIVRMPETRELNYGRPLERQLPTYWRKIKDYIRQDEYKKPNRDEVKIELVEKFRQGIGLRAATKLAEDLTGKPINKVLDNLLYTGLSWKVEHFGSVKLHMRAERILDMSDEVLRFIWKDDRLKQRLATVANVSLKKKKRFLKFEFEQMREYLKACHDRDEHQRQMILQPTEGALIHRKIRLDKESKRREKEEENNYKYGNTGLRRNYRY